MKFAEITENRRFSLGPVRVEEPDALAFARNYDDQWFHTDPVRAQAGPFQGLIASGWHTCALAMQLVSRDILAGSESYASPGLSYLRWPNPVRPGDLLTLEIQVLESRISASRPWLGIVRWQWQMHNQKGTQVLDLEATSMFKIGEEPG
ncbi:MaoC family dehydratase [Herbaspirillum sp. RTI4]|uniref:MaoC family dehydratase n=1 Tax=Herbaspirillum sp. RTI4 TaxID=3048640 RepID=UPI002AB4210C|nr:MaoC family dehydratase [Herbaspirillum sp. RTI4]MDY7578420.1 MaoC family dehydratase [Herbaspirillum sp. RTI4]MEA9982566.1 MaoC family dehydratase [Herbaspirillum sp. RTI4]